MKPLLAAFVLLIASTATAADASRITLDNYNRVQEAQSLQAVRSILGQETMIDSQIGRFKSLVWRVGSADNPSKYVHVSFTNDKVTGKFQSGL
jgi:hypothetical protein